MNSASTLRELYLEGQRRWPTFDLSWSVFEAHCERVGCEDEAEAPPREGADLYLCCACIEADAEALRLFLNEALEVARAAVSRLNRDEEFVQDVLQSVWDKLLVGPEAKVRQYSGRGPLKAWVRVSATRVALDRCRSGGIRALREVELSEQLAARSSNPESFLTQRRFGPAFQEAMARAVAALTAQERNVLRMHVTGGCSIDEIGRAYNVHRATAARWLERSRTRIYETVRGELCERSSKLTESEFRSLAHLLQSQLELHFSAPSLSSIVQSAHG